MKDAIEDAYEEIKRIDHLIYVSLKYTRTVDVFKSIIKRMINSFDCIINGLLKKLLGEKKIEEIPASIKVKCDLLKSTYKNDEALNDYLNFYLLLRKLNRAEYTKRNEFRRHVTMSATIDDGKIVEVTIDSINEYFERIKAFLMYIREKHMRENFDLE